MTWDWEKGESKKWKGCQVGHVVVLPVCYEPLRKSVSLSQSPTRERPSTAETRATPGSVETHQAGRISTVSYTHLTLPTKRIV